MANLSLREVAQSQLDLTPVIDGQLIVCTDTGSTYRDIGTNRIQISKDLEIVSSLPLAPLSNKIYFLRPDSLYVYSGGDWVLLNPSKFTLEADKNAINGDVNINLVLAGEAQDKVKVAGSGITTVTTDEVGDITIDTPHPDEILEALTNDDIDKITGGMVDDEGNPNPIIPITVDASLTVSGRAADAKVTGDKIKDVQAIAKSADSGLTNVRKELAQLKLKAVTVDATLSQEGYAADAKAVGDKFDSQNEKINTKSDIGHTHDDSYFTKDEINKKLSDKSDTDHTHDERYYTETEMDEKLTGKADVIDVHTITIPITNWQTDENLNEYRNYIDLAISGITAKDVVAMDVLPDDSSVASIARFTNPETFDGYIRLRSKYIPTKEITAQWYIVHGGGYFYGNGTIQSDYILEAYPVGSIYMSLNSTSPSKLFGGE